jgi:ParB-like chromosome segregation protein Spo0J
MIQNKKQVKIESIFENESNPRFINKKAFEKLVKSIKAFPEMLEKRPIIIDEKNIILGGNMRLKACKEAGLKKVWVDQVTDWSEKQKREFIIKDNVGFGEWDWDILGNEYSFEELANWGLNVSTGADEIEDLSEALIADLKIEITVKSEDEQEQLFEELSKRGYKCRVLTL